MDTILEQARDDKAGELAQAYLARKPSAVKLIHQLLAGAGLSIDAIMAEGMVDHLATNAENRRNASLREIDRRRQVLRETPRPTAHKVEDGEFQVIETTPAEGKDAA
jgi:hypothetical protein